MCRTRGEAGPSIRSTSTSSAKRSTGPPPIIRLKIRSTSGGRRSLTISSSITSNPKPHKTATRYHWEEYSMSIVQRIIRGIAAAACAALVASGAFAQNAQPPIRIGSTLALTGPLAATSLVHKVVGEIYVEQLNKRGGLLGRQVEWIVKDDQSKPDLARTLYEQLITSDKVDLLMGPYATGAILSAMGVAQRYNKVLVHHTFGIPSMAKYDMQSPAWSLGPDPQTTVSNSLFDLMATAKTPPKTIAIVTSKFPSIHFMSLGGREVAKKRGY